MEHKYKLSVICPGIRRKNWLRLYESIKESFSGEFELIFIGPEEPLHPVSHFHNVKYTRDMGTPIRAQQIGLIACEGEYVTWAADDGKFLRGALDKAFSLLEPNSLVMGKYYEGNNDGDLPMQDDGYYILSNHDATRIKWTQGFYMLNVGIVSRETLLEVGGWDAENFEVCPMAYNDLAIRLQRKGVKFIIQQEMMFKCSHLPGHAGDHGPVHDAQTMKDEPRFRSIYGTEQCLKRIKIDINNWKLSPERWARRFG